MSEEWIDVKKELPKKGEWILYSAGYEEMICYGRYCGEDDPMPSAYWLPWERVTFWMRPPDFPKKEEKLIHND